MVLLRVDPGLVIWLWITFGIVLVILRLTVWDKIIGGLDKRSERIAGELENARQAGERAAASHKEVEQILREGRAEAARIIEQARTDAVGLREQMDRQAADEIREMKARASLEVEKAREEAELALRDRIVTMSFSIADALLRRETGTADNRAFVEEFASKLSSGQARN
jgi:F-type H+-transporting ATPase subunit b